MKVFLAIHAFAFVALLVRDREYVATAWRIITQSIRAKPSVGTIRRATAATALAIVFVIGRAIGAAAYAGLAYVVIKLMVMAATSPWPHL